MSVASRRAWSSASWSAVLSSALLLALVACGRDPAAPPATHEPADTPPVPEAPRSDPARTAEIGAHVAALKDADPSVRLAAARALEALDPPPVEAVDALAAALADENRWVREWSARALIHLGEAAAPAVPALTRALTDSDDFVRWRAAEALAHVGRAAAPALPVLREAASTQRETAIGKDWAQEAVRRIEAALEAAPDGDG